MGEESHRGRVLTGCTPIVPGQEDEAIPSRVGVSRDISADPKVILVNHRSERETGQRKGEGW